MSFPNEYDVAHRKEELVDLIASVVGHEPPGVRVLLRAMSHPDVVTEMRRYLELIDENTRCLTYEPPWSCAREAEARYENIQYGWLGGAGGIGFDSNWCENCRKKVLGNE